MTEATAEVQTTYYEEKATADARRTVRCAESVSRGNPLLKKSLKFLAWSGSVHRCGKRQVVFGSEYVDGKGAGVTEWRGGSRGQVGRGGGAYDAPIGSPALTLDETTTLK